MPHIAMTANKGLVVFLMGSNILVKRQGLAGLGWNPGQLLTSCVILGFSFLISEMVDHDGYPVSACRYLRKRI